MEPFLVLEGLAALRHRLPELLAPQNYLGASDELIDRVLARCSAR